MQLIALMFLLLAAATIQAQPTIIYDSGRTVSADAYRLFLTTDDKPSFIKNNWIFSSEPTTEKVDPDAPQDDLFPIKTRKLTPAKIAQEKNIYQASMPGPTCIVGSDALSKSWIQKNIQHLQQMNAMCLIVQAKNQDEADELLAMLNGLIVSAGDGDVLADYFHIKHYPVLITERVIFQ